MSSSCLGDVLRLQRSRRPKTAESSRHARRARRAQRRFNGAAVRRRRRVEARLRSVAVRSHASTEPPSEDGGELAAASSTDRAGSRRFNGAAVRRRRRAAPRPRASSSGSSQLQRSRRPKTAERLSRSSAEVLGDRHASTEPPSEDGGEQGATERLVRGADRLLQRSRRPKTAERTCERHARDVALIGCASTEPPSEDGGE